MQAHIKAETAAPKRSLRKLTIGGLVLVAAGVLSILFSRAVRGGAYLSAILVIAGTGLQVYEMWAKLPAQCRSWTGAFSCVVPASTDVKTKRR